MMKTVTAYAAWVVGGLALVLALSYGMNVSEPDYGYSPFRGFIWLLIGVGFLFIGIRLFISADKAR